jgi:hypothetical protein
MASDDEEDVGMTEEQQGNLVGLPCLLSPRRNAYPSSTHSSDGTLLISRQTSPCRHEAPTYGRRHHGELVVLLL